MEKAHSLKLLLMENFGPDPVSMKANENFAIAFKGTGPLFGEQAVHMQLYSPHP